MRVLIVPDKFKGTLTAAQAAAAIAAGWREARPADVLELLPMSDGGDGFGSVMGPALQLAPQSYATMDAAGRRRNVTFWFSERTRVALFEVAEVNGLATLAQRYHPTALDSFGLGLVLLRLWQLGAKRVILGLGGSATNDGGFGLGRALGFGFLDAGGRPIRQWHRLAQLARVVVPRVPLHFDRLEIAVDVTNPLLGPRGATYTFGPQKGLLTEQLAAADSALAHYAALVEDALGKRFAENAGAGAAGGLGFALHAFCGGALVSGGELFLRENAVAQRVEAADHVVTGEGAFDAQSFMGKGVGQVVNLAQALGRPCSILCGVSTASASMPAGVVLRSISPALTSSEAARREAASWLRQLTARRASEL